MNENYLNLDKLMAEKKSVRFLGRNFELGYIPCGLSIPILKLHNDQIARETAAVKNNKPLTNEELMENELKVVSTFCSFYDKDFTYEFISHNATDKQLYAMYVQIVASIIENFGAVTENQTDQTEAETKGKKKRTGAS